MEKELGQKGKKTRWLGQANIFFSSVLCMTAHWIHPSNLQYMKGVIADSRVRGKNTFCFHLLVFFCFQCNCSFWNTVAYEVGAVSPVVFRKQAQMTVNDGQGDYGNIMQCGSYTLIKVKLLSTDPLQLRSESFRWEVKCFSQGYFGKHGIKFDISVRLHLHSIIVSPSNSSTLQNKCDFCCSDDVTVLVVPTGCSTVGIGHGGVGRLCSSLQASRCGGM